MEQYTSKFLGKTGLTSAEANYTANIVKELCEKINNDIKGMTLMKGTIHFQGKESDYNTVHTVGNLTELCLEEGNLYALSAWLREGIKAKEFLLNMCTVDNFGISVGIEHPVAPKTEPLLSEENIKWQLPIDELADYLAWEAKAAHIGKKVHPNGVFDTWFTALKSTPRTQLHPENKEFVVIFQQVVDEKSLYSIYFDLQKEYREAEQKVNYYKAKIKNLLAQENIQITGRNKEANAKYQSELANYRAADNKADAEITAKRIEVANELSELRIIIPNSLQKTLDYVQSVGKK